MIKKLFIILSIIMCSYSVALGIGMTGHGKDNQWTAKTNGKLDLVMGGKDYTDKAPAGENSVNFTWEIRKDLGVTFRIEPGDKISILIQDDLTGLSTFKAWIYGHYVTD